MREFLLTRIYGSVVNVSRIEDAKVAPDDEPTYEQAIAERKKQKSSESDKKKKTSKKKKKK